MSDHFPLQRIHVRVKQQRLLQNQKVRALRNPSLNFREASRKDCAWVIPVREHVRALLKTAEGFGTREAQGLKPARGARLRRG